MDVDARTLLKKADELFTNGEFRAAAELYMHVGKHYLEQGFFVKAVALFKQVRDLAKTLDPALDADARTLLIASYRKLGLIADAEKLEAEPTTLH